jgi:copper(I)-binding protein
MLKRLLHVTLLLFFIQQAAAATAGDIEIKDAWVRSAPPNVAVMAGYLDIINHADHAIKLTGVSSRQFETVEVHRTIMRDGMMHMEKMEPLLLAPKQKVEFKPGGFHLMMMNPHQPLLRGDKVGLVFNFSDGEQLMLETTVRDQGPKGMGMDMNMEMGHGGGHHSH